MTGDLDLAQASDPSAGLMTLDALGDPARSRVGTGDPSGSPGRSGGTRIRGGTRIPPERFRLTISRSDIGNRYRMEFERPRRSPPVVAGAGALASTDSRQTGPDRSGTATGAGGSAGCAGRTGPDRTGSVPGVCLLVVLFQVVPGAPLVVAANRDERYDRPATGATVLSGGPPRIVGGRDEVAGGTWLATNEHGVVAGLTNRPVQGGRDASLRSRGMLPLALAGHRRADEAAAALVGEVRAADYNPCWLLVGDRHSLVAVTVDAARGDVPVAEALAPGVHVLENRPLHEPSPKVDRVRSLVGRARASLSGAGAPASVAALLAVLGPVLADHQIPGGDPDGAVGGDWRPAAVSACCVHTPEYGTRSSSVVVVPDAAGPPALAVADGHPCTTPFVDASGLWAAAG